MSFTVAVPDGQDPVVIYNMLKDQLAAVTVLGGAEVIAVINLEPININIAPVIVVNDTTTNNNGTTNNENTIINDNTINNNNNNNTNNPPLNNQDPNQIPNQPIYDQQVSASDSSNKQLAIILGVVIPLVIVVLLIGGYCIRKRYF